jgi:serine/threonine protein kinase
MNTVGELGGYTLLREIGRGTMGTVYLASSPGLDSVHVAIKRLPVFGSDEDMRRLRREAETMSELNHPHIMAVLDVIDDGNGIAFVMPFAEGGTLQQRLQNGPLSEVEMVAVVAPIADALAFAHSRGILHRDVKPSNILFTSEGVPVLTDFGIARNSSQTNITRTDIAIGTAGYLDPDLADGAEPSARSDQYALGVVAYESLLGKSPFVGATPLAVLRHADRGDHELLDFATYGATARIIERSFHRNPQRRFNSLQGFAEALRHPSAYFDPGASEEFRVAKVDVHVGQSDETNVDATRAFRRQQTVSNLAEATPTRPSKRRQLVITGAAVVAAFGLGGAIVATRTEQAPTLAKLPEPKLPKCDPQATTQCVLKAIKTPNGVSVSFANGKEQQFDIGDAQDAVRVNNWFCGEKATVALYRPSSGVIYYANNWPVDNAQIELLADNTGIKNAKVWVGDFNNDECADLALELNGKRTWFLPVTQTSRLQRVATPALEQKSS